ncbi:MAG: hypothetical protein IJ770_00685 [Alphaproteobacteria bacterium]|nr:hypothetical protein [Alphaproteobacteria bacterium]
MSQMRRAFSTTCTYEVHEKKKLTSKNIRGKNPDNESDAPCFFDNVYKRGTRGEKTQADDH